MNEQHMLLTVVNLTKTEHVGVKATLFGYVSQGTADFI